LEIFVRDRNDRPMAEKMFQDILESWK